MVWETGIRVYDNFFPLDLLCELSHEALTQEERKIKYDTLDGSPFPEPFNRAARHIVDTIPACINTVISKRYEPGVPSSAYDYHDDPEEYADDLILCSLGARATLTVIDMNVGMFDLKCRTNRVITVPPRKVHKISPPIGISSVRPFIFFGHQDPNFDHTTVTQHNFDFLDDWHR